MGIGDLDGIEPGVGLATVLASIDSSMLSAHDRVTVLKAHQRMVAHHQALAYREVAQIYEHFLGEDDDVALAHISAVSEIAAALHLTRRAAEFEVELAVDLNRRLVSVEQALASGRIDLRRVRTFSRETCHVEDQVARAIVAGAVERAATMTAGQLAAHLRRRCLQQDPEAARKRYREAVEHRRVVLEADETGTAHLSGFNLAPDLATRAMARICDLAEAARTPGDSRTIDHLRADVFLDLLLEGGKGKKQGVVNIHVDLETLTRLSESPGELAGYGPVIADIARQVAEQQLSGQWRFTIEDAESGQTLANGITRRRPTTAQRRRVEAENPTCIHPGCRAPAQKSDLDHRLAYASGGLTKTSNLDPLCRFHHVLRHRAAWTRRPLTNGDHLFVSRLGHQYTTSGRSP